MAMATLEVGIFIFLIGSQNVCQCGELAQQKLGLSLAPERCQDVAFAMDDNPA